MALADLTELEAVNQVLASAGHQNISALDLNTNAIATMAENLVDRVNREMQSEGWWFNTERNVTYSPAGDEVALGDDILHADAYDHQSGNYVKRGSKLYNLTEHTFTFPDGTDVQLDIVKCLDWTDLPTQARQYIVAKASRMMAEQYLLDQTLITAYAREEMAAKARLTTEHAKQADANFLTGNIYRNRVLNRGGRGPVERGFI